jgi:DoxX-like protein
MAEVCTHPDASFGSFTAHVEGRGRGKSSKEREMNRGLWIVQGVLAALFLFAGGSKLVMPLDQLTGPVALPGWFLRFIGVAEVLGGLGLFLPGLLRVRPGLTPLAATGLLIIMLGATGLGLSVRDVTMTAIPAVVALALGFVAYGRWRLAPHRGAQVSAFQPAR